MPIPFTCPHCGATTEVLERYAGQSGPCASCGKTITVPGGPAGAVHAAAVPRNSSNTTVLVIVVAVSVLAILVCGGVLVGLLLPAVQSARGAARRAMCMNNMKQIGLAIHSYHSVYGEFPPAYVADENGRPMHSWRVLILPFLDQDWLYQMYDFEKPWDHLDNMALADMMPAIYRCPGEPMISSSETSYLMLVGPGAFSEGPTGRRIQEFTDGTSNTMMITESVGSGICWLEPRDCDVQRQTFRINDGTAGGLQSAHPGKVNVVFADGAAYSLDEGTDPQTVRAWTTVDGGEAVQSPTW